MSAAFRTGERHAVVLGCMVALYMTERDVRTPEPRAMTASDRRRQEVLARLLVPAMEMWRLRTLQNCATH